MKYKKYLSPWIKSPSNGYTRQILGDSAFYRIYYYAPDFWCYFGDSGQVIFTTLKQAKKSFDDWLIKDGCIFLTQEQWDKLQVLL